MTDYQYILSKLNADGYTPVSVNAIMQWCKEADIKIDNARARTLLLKLRTDSNVSSKITHRGSRLSSRAFILSKRDYSAPWDIELPSDEIKKAVENVVPRDEHGYMLALFIEKLCIGRYHLRFHPPVNLFYYKRWFDTDEVTISKMIDELVNLKLAVRKLNGDTILVFNQRDYDNAAAETKKIVVFDVPVKERKDYDNLRSIHTKIRSLMFELNHLLDEEMMLYNKLTEAVNEEKEED